MRVVFLEDVPNVARAGDMKEVADGYGRNFLIPKKLAILASSTATSVLEAQRRAKARQQAQTEAEFAELANQLEGKEVSLKVRVGSKGRAYGSITSADIAAELETSAGIVIDKRKIELAEPIRQAGSYEVDIRLAKDIMPKIKVVVTEEEAKETKETKETKGIKKTRKTEKTKETEKTEEETKEAEETKETKEKD